MKIIVTILFIASVLIPLAVQAAEIEVEAQPVEITESDTAATEYASSGSKATLGWPAYTYFWGSFNYEYVLKREQLIMGLEFATNALPLGLKVYTWIDFSGPMAGTYPSGADPTISNLTNHVGTFNISWPLNSYKFLAIDWLDLKAKYNVSSFSNDNVFFGINVRFFDIPALKGLKDALDSIGYPGGATLNCGLFPLRTDGKHGHDNWMRFAIFYKIPFNIAGVNCYTQAWADIDVSNPNDAYGIGDHTGHGTLSFQNTVAVNVWSHLWLWWELKDEAYNYWSTGAWSQENIVWDNSLGASWQVTF